MKIIFFLIAFFLVSIRFYFSWVGKDRENRGISTSNMVIKGDHFYEEIKYSGKFQLTDDETGFKSISPGGYFKFIKNEISVKAESSLTGAIEYRINDGKNTMRPDEQEKKLVAEAVKEMINQGFDANARIERIFRKGGTQALINEIDSMRIDQIKMLYLNRLFTIDSLSPDNLVSIIKKVESLNSDMDRGQFLIKISPERLKSPQIAAAYFEIIDDMHSDIDKSDVLQHLLEKDSVSEENTFKILNISRRMGSDMDRAVLYNRMIDKGLINGNRFDSMINLISGMNSAIDVVNLYENLIKGKDISESQWISLIGKAGLLASDFDKSNLLMKFAQRMPKTEPITSAYLKACKSINNDNDYGRAVRAVE